MNYRGVTESVLERSALAWLEALGYVVLRLPAAQSVPSRQEGGPDISPAGVTLTPTLSQREREGYKFVVLEGRLRQALMRLNPDLSECLL